MCLCVCQEVLPDFRGLNKTKQILSAQSKLRIKDKLQQLFGKKLADEKNSKKEKMAFSRELGGLGLKGPTFIGF